MEAKVGLDTPPCRTDEVAGCSTVLTRSNSDKSALTADNCKDVLFRSDDCRAWTDEKHNSFLNQLEVSFVTQLQQSKSLVRKSYELKDRHIHMSSNDSTGARNSSGQNIKSERTELLSHTSADSCYQTKNVRHPPSVDIGLSTKPSCMHKRKKEVVCPQQSSTSNVYHEQSFEITREGTDQNFSEDDHVKKTKIGSQAKRLRTASANSPTLDQVVPQDMSNDKC